MKVLRSAKDISISKLERVTAKQAYTAFQIVAFWMGGGPKTATKGCGAFA
jgi:hypothetical protein